MAGAADRGEIAHVGEVADAPGALRAHRVQLGLDPECAPGGVLGVDGQPGGRDHEVRFDRALRGLGDQSMPAQRQSERHVEACAAPQRPVELEGRVWSSA